MNTNLAKATIIFLFLTLTLTGTVLAQTTVVGVSPGNTFNYSYNLSWASTNPAATIPPAYLELQNIQSMRINVVSVTDSLINIDITKLYKNGTENTQNGNINVDTQLLELPYSIMIIRAGANTDEKIYPSGGHATLSETATKTYSIGTIETIRYVSVDNSVDSNQETEIIYDKANGVGLEYNFESQETSGSYVTTTTETLMITSWVIPEFPFIAVLMIMIIAIPIVLVVYKKTASSNHNFAITLKQ